jgi:hypothetical protein
LRKGKWTTLSWMLFTFIFIDITIWQALIIKATLSLWLDNPNGNLNN